MPNFEAGSISILLRAAADRIGPTLQKARGVIEVFGRAVQGVSNRMRIAGQALIGVWRRVRLFVVATLGISATAAGKLAVDFESSMSKIVGLVGIGRDQVNAWKEDVLRLGKEVGKGPNELAEGLFFITSAGLEGKEALDALRASAQAATAGLGETKTVADAATSAMAAYKDINLAAEDAIGILVATVREGKAEADSIAPALGRVIPIASELGVSFNEVGASIAAMTRTGLSAEEAATALRGILSNLLNPSEEVRRSLEEMGLSLEGLRTTLKTRGVLGVLQDLKGTFGENTDALQLLIPEKRALTGALSLVGKNAAEATKIFKALAKAGRDDLAGAFAEAETTMRVRFGKAFAQLQVGLIRFGTAVLPAIVPVFERLASGFETVAGKAGAFAITLRETVTEIRQAIADRGLGQVLVDLSDAVISGFAKIAGAVLPIIVDFGATAVRAFFVSAAAAVPKSMHELIASVLILIADTAEKVAIFIRIPFDFAGKLLEQLARRVQVVVNKMLQGLALQMVKLLEVLPDVLVPDSAIDFLKGFIVETEKAAKVAQESQREIAGLWDEAVREGERRAADSRGQGIQALAEILAKMDAAANESAEARGQIIEAEIASVLTKFRGAMAELSPELLSLFEGIGQGLGVNADRFVDRLRSELKKLEAEHPEIAHTPTKFGGAGGAFRIPRSTVAVTVVPKRTPEQDAAIKRFGDETAGILGNALGTAIRTAIEQDGIRGVRILAAVGRQIMDEAIENSINSFKAAMSTAIQKLGVEAEGVTAGVINVAIAAVGFLLSQLDKQKSTTRFGRVRPEIESSQLVRGIVAGPTNVAIAEVGDNLRRAMVGVEGWLAIISGDIKRVVANTAAGGGAGRRGRLAGTVATP